MKNLRSYICFYFIFFVGLQSSYFTIKKRFEKYIGIFGKAVGIKLLSLVILAQQNPDEMVILVCVRYYHKQCISLAMLENLYGDIYCVAFTITIYCDRISYVNEI